MREKLQAIVDALAVVCKCFDVTVVETLRELEGSDCQSRWEGGDMDSASTCHAMSSVPVLV